MRQVTLEKLGCPNAENRKRYGTMKDMTKDEELVALRKALKEKERELAEANLKVEALNVLIDLAEEHGMPVRKNSAAKR